MTPDEASLLLFLETCAVDHSGGVDVRHMNEEDMETALRWNTEGFIEFGRVSARDAKTVGGGYVRTHYVKLLGVTWAMAALECRARAERAWSKREYSIPRRSK